MRCWWEWICIYIGVGENEYIYRERERDYPWEWRVWVSHAHSQMNEEEFLGNNNWWQGAPSGEHRDATNQVCSCHLSVQPIPHDGARIWSNWLALRWTLACDASWSANSCSPFYSPNALLSCTLVTWRLAFCPPWRVSLSSFDTFHISSILAIAWGLAHFFPCLLF